MWQKRKGGGTKRLYRKVVGREVAEDKEQVRLGGMVLTDPAHWECPHAPRPVSASWFQFSVPFGGLVTCSTVQIVSGY